MDTRVEQITRALKGYRHGLFAARRSNGMIGVYKKTVRWESHPWEGGTLHYSRPSRTRLFVLTDNWTERGKIVEWGVEPILAHMREGDYDRDDTVFKQFRDERETKERLRDRALTNELKAVAADSRVDVQRAFSPFNLSSVKKTDSRRKRNGNRK